MGETVLVFSHIIDEFEEEILRESDLVQFWDLLNLLVNIISHSIDMCIGDLFQVKFLESKQILHDYVTTISFSEKWNIFIAADVGSINAGPEYSGRA